MAMSNEGKHEHPGGEIPHKHTEGDELATHGSGRTTDVHAADVRTTTTGAETLQLREEELQARKQSVEAGRVRVGKEVIEEQQTLNVPVTHEEVTIERHAVDRRPAEGTIGASGETISVPVREEQVSVDKRAVVTEEITVGKQQVQETQQVSGTVRREEARIERQGDVDIEPQKR